MKWISYNIFHTFPLFRIHRIWGDGGFVCINISSCYQNLAALMLIFTFLSTLLKYMVVAALCTRSVSYFSRPLPLPRSSPPKFSIGVASVAISAVIRPLLVKRRELPCRRSNSPEGRSVSSSGSLHLIMTVVLIFSSYLPLIIQLENVNLMSFLSVGIHEVSFWPPTLIRTR